MPRKPKRRRRSHPKRSKPTPTEKTSKTDRVKFWTALINFAGSLTKLFL